MTVFLEANWRRQIEQRIRYEIKEIDCLKEEVCLLKDENCKLQWVLKI